MEATHNSRGQTRVERHCLDLMYSQTRAAWLSNAFCIALLWIAFWDTASRPALLLWTGACAILMVLRDLQATRYAKRAGTPINARRWMQWLEGSLLANGCLLGIGCAALAVIATPYQLTIIVLIVGGLQTGSVLASSYNLRAFALFSLPLFLLTLAALVYIGFRDDLTLLVTAALLLVWSAFVMLCASRFGQHYRRSLEFSFQNLDLAESLQAQQGKNEALNQSLKERIGELKSTQTQLLAEKHRSDGLVEQLRQLSTTDGLTQLGNRRAFDDQLSREWQRGRRHQQPLALVFIDVDHFKTYNDRYGHQEGDRCLAMVAETLAAAARGEGDWAARYGGEEFAVLLANTSLRDACNVAEQIRQNVASLGLEHASSDVGPIVTVSLGVAGLTPLEGVAPAALVAAADRALYTAKRDGRNRVITNTTWQPTSDECGEITASLQASRQ